MAPPSGRTVAPVGLELGPVRELFERFGAVVHGAAGVMATRSGGLSADDITVAAFVGLAREGRFGDDDLLLGRLLRLAGRAARTGMPIG